MDCAESNLNFVNGWCIGSIIACVSASPLFFHALNAILFDRPLIDDVESQPVRATHSGSAVHRWAPRAVLISLMFKIRLCLPLPKLTYTSHSCERRSNKLKWVIKMTTTSESTVFTSTVLASSRKACNTWITILVSASSWSHSCLTSCPGPTWRTFF